MNKYLKCFALTMMQFTLCREVSNNNPFDAAIRQIDTQSKELNQQIVLSQQDGLASQKIQRLELELSTIKNEHSQEIALLKKQHEQHITTLKTELTHAQQAQTNSVASLKTITKELEDARKELAQFNADQTMINDLKSAIATMEQERKEYNAFKAEVAKEGQELKQGPLIVSSAR